jgi:hypothetical protein
MIYAGSSPAVSQLEYMCINGNAVGLNSWFMVVYDIADDTLIGTLEADHLPLNWNVLPHGRSTQNFGKSWLQEMEFPFLRVPSARVNIAFYPEVHNLLINPDFPALTDLIKVVKAVPFNYLLG